MSPDQIEDRIETLRAYIDGFVKLVYETESVTLKINSQEAAVHICTLYERYVEDVVRPAIDSTKIQNYKIIANTELVTLRVAPIIYPENSEIQNRLNAKLAFHIALSFLIDWNNLDADKVLKIVVTDHEIKSFLEEHLQWLCLLDARYLFPIFSNSQVWRLFYILLRDRMNSL